MVVKLIVVWAVAVVAFFALWAVLAKVVKRISEKKHSSETAEKEARSEDAID
jgi:flagellar biosynthesis/type III secretory pathway M-ring protein FliF/YscJ